MTSEIVSPLPGTFYRAPGPDQPPFKREGDWVAIGDTIGVVEVMKSFHPVESEVEGRLARFLIENEDPVMPGEAVAELE